MDYVVIAPSSEDVAVEDQKLAVSLGIPVLPVKYLEQQASQTKSEKRKNEAVENITPQRRSKRQRVSSLGSTNGISYFELLSYFSPGLGSFSHSPALIAAQSYPSFLLTRSRIFYFLKLYLMLL